MRNSRIPELDGLRGIAILFVLLFHYASQEGVERAGSLAAFVQRTVVMGATGVDLFFVLSGFLIGGILMDARESPSYFRTFYIRRFYRIIPIYYLWTTLYIVLVGTAGAFLTAHTHSGVKPPLGWHIYIHYLFLQNLVALNLAGLAGAWFGPAWSLAVEEQFYLVAPAVVRLVSPKRLSAVVIATICAAPIMRLVMLQAGRPAPEIIAGLTPARADTLALGVLGALLWRRPGFHRWAAARGRLLYVLLALFMVGFAALWKWSPQTQTYAMESIGFSCVGFTYGVVLLLALLRSRGPIAVVTRMRWLRELGRISYCVYLIHVAVNVICHAVLLHDTPRISTLKGVLVTLFAALLTCVLARVSWIVFEGPFHRRGQAYQYLPPEDAPESTIGEYAT